MPVRSGRDARPALPPELLRRWRRIPVPVAVDLTDPSCQIDPAIRPICPPGRQPPLCGRAVTALCAPPDFGAVIHALDRVGPGDVLVIAANGHRDHAMIGDVLCGHLLGRGGAGVVCDGAIRDVRAVQAMPGFAAYARSVTPRGPVGAQTGEVEVPVRVGGCLVTPGDLILGDDDGLASLTPDLLAGLIDAAESKVALEAEWRARLAAGIPAPTVFGLGPAQEV